VRRIRPPRRGLKLPPPILVADSWFGDSKFMGHVATAHEGILLVEGKSTYVFALPDGRQVKGHDLQTHSDWPWRHSPQVPGVRYVRLRATSPTYGAVIITIVNEASADRVAGTFAVTQAGHDADHPKYRVMPSRIGKP
jgi:hypothetical protein